LKNVGPIRNCEPSHAQSPGVATGTVARRLRIDVHDDNDNALQRGLLWPHGMGPMTGEKRFKRNVHRAWNRQKKAKVCGTVVVNSQTGQWCGQFADSKVSSQRKEV